MIGFLYTIKLNYMKVFNIPRLPINLERNLDKKLNDRDVPGIEMEYLWPENCPRNLFSGAFVAAGTDGLAVSFCAETPYNRISAVRTEPKTSVFNEDCLELFIQPENSSIYYGFEINPKDACLDYRVFVEPEKNNTEDVIKNLPSYKSGHFYDEGEKVTGLLSTEVAGVNLTFDYDWQSKAVYHSTFDDEFWYLELFIPWSDFGLNEMPAAGAVWHGTLNRIDAAENQRRSKKAERVPGLQCLLDETKIPAFHQPGKFAEFCFTDSVSD